MINSDPVDYQQSIDSAVVDFITYLKFKTVHPNPNYYPALNWLIKVAKDAGLETFMFELTRGKPILIVKWAGIHQDLPSILLNSHVDVVPVDGEKWKFDPFSAEIHDGKIYARGAQDMKCLGIQYLHAVKQLKSQNIIPYRNVFLSYVPDEEIGGKDGMKAFVESTSQSLGITLSEMNPILILDEGLTSPTDSFTAYYEERSPWWIEVTLFGNSGHGLKFIENTAIEAFHRVLEKVHNFRDAKKRELYEGNLTLGDVTSINLTQIQFGKQVNIVPSEIKFTLDIRISVSDSYSEIEEMIESWCREATQHYKLEYLNKHISYSRSAVLPTRENSSAWRALYETGDEFSISINQRIFEGSTDSRFLRGLQPVVTTSSFLQHQIRAINFTPIRNVPSLLHDHNEYVTVNKFKEGCLFYTSFLKRLVHITDLN